MEFKKLANNSINFGINRIIEILGLTIIIMGVLLLISLASFSPNDPNFIFPDNTEIKKFFLVFVVALHLIFFSVLWVDCSTNSL